MSDDTTSSINSAVQLIADLKDPGRRAEAERTLWKEYHGPLTRIIARRIAVEFKGKISPDSIGQAAFLAFLRWAEADDFVVQDRDELLGALVRTAIFKLLDRLRWEKIRMPPGTDLVENATVEELGGGTKPLPADSDRRPYSQPVDSQVAASSYYNRPPEDLLLMEMDPLGQAVAKEAWDKLDEDLQLVAALALEGRSDLEISRILNIDRPSVTRKKERIRQRWEEIGFIDPEPVGEPPAAAAPDDPGTRLRKS